MDLTDDERALAAGEGGAAAATAMRILTRVGDAVGAERMLEVTSAHIDSCLYHGDAGLDFAERLVDEGGHVAVPTTLNVSSLDLLHPDLFRGDEHLAERGRRLMAAYVAMGGVPSWTCAPYQLIRRPGLGEHVAWAESNAIVFVNSVLGARTDRYGDFIDICAAITGRVPAAGLHLDEHRAARIVFHVEDLSPALLASEVLYPVLGHLIGKEAGTHIPAIVGLPSSASEDDLKALGAGGASSGGIAMFHAVGRTPEAPDLATATQGMAPEREVTVTMESIRAARDELTTSADGPLGAVSVGTPHFSFEEFRTLAGLLGGKAISPELEFYVNTGREVLSRAAAEGLLTPLRDAGVEVVTDTCTYITPIMRNRSGVVMTNSSKWAYYAPGNLGLDVAFGSLADCVASAVAGRITRDEGVWGG